MAILTEHSTKISVELPTKDVHKKMDVFYNPVMTSNRNISLVLLNSIPNTGMNICDPLAGTGIRSLRFLNEVEKDKIQNLFVNDKKENFVKVFENNLKLNRIKNKKITLKNQEASLFLLTQHTDDFCGYFDYIDIDPFGSPNPFLSAAICQIKREGILAITATDTAALTGTYPKATKRKYWATQLKNHLMHETGLRILIRKVQLQGIQFDKALIPILSYSKDHYFRLYFRSEKGKTKSDELLKQHQYLLFCSKCLNYKTSIYNNEQCACKNQFQFVGPLWAGPLFDKQLLATMAKTNPFPEDQKFLDLLKDEKDVVGFHDLHVISKKYKIEPPKMEMALQKLHGTRTHFSPNGVKTEKDIKEIIKLLG